jgi:thiol-disulfide isomerase/thioredoxin
VDRLHPLSALCAAALWIAVACDEPQSPSAPPPGRVQAVQAKKSNDDPLDGFCDIKGEPGQGPRYAWPPMDAAPKTEAGGWQWVNVWATWCKPCIEEMPMIARWQQDLAGDGVQLTTHFLSVDEDVELLSAFKQAHPETPQTMHMGDPEVLGTWMGDLGLDSGAGLPIHIFVEPTGGIRCARAGAITQSHYAIVRDMVR